MGRDEDQGQAHGTNPHWKCELSKRRVRHEERQEESAGSGVEDVKVISGWFHAERKADIRYMDEQGQIN